MSFHIPELVKNEFNSILEHGGTIDEALARIDDFHFGIEDSIKTLEKLLNYDREKAEKIVRQSKVWAGHIKENEKKALKYARGILNKEIDAIKGCTLLHSICAQIEIDSKEEFLIFKLIDSETDHLPIGEAKKLASKEFLLKSKKEAEKIISFYWKDIKEGCEALLKRFDKI